MGGAVDQHPVQKNAPERRGGPRVSAHISAPLERVSATWPVRLQRPSDGLAKASQSARNLLADFCIELGYPCLGGFRALARCIVPRLRLSLLVFALAAKFLETQAKPLERLGVLA